MGYGVPMLIHLVTAAWAQCEGTPSRTSLELTTALEAAEAAYRDADADGFLGATREMETILPCISEQVPRSLVARVHRTFGMRAFVSRKPDRAGAAFRAANALQPDYVFPPEMVPPQHPMVTLYATSKQPGKVEAVPKPAEGNLVFDGRRSLERPLRRLTLLQKLTPNEDLEGSWVLWPGDPMPSYTVASASTETPEPIAPPPPAPSQKQAKKGPNLPLLLGAGAALALAGGTYAFAGASRSQYDKAHVDHLDTLKGRTNALVLTSAGLGVVGVGLGVGAVATGKW